MPGGIFNKGFVKSFAKYVGLDEQEAIQDYSRIISTQEHDSEDDPKTYRPEVLTDESVSSSNVPDNYLCRRYFRFDDVGNFGTC